MSTNPAPISNFPNFTPADFTDPTMFKFNSTMRIWFGQLANLYQSGLTTTLGANLIVPSIVSNNQNTPPTNVNTLITLQTANTLFSPSTQRTALATGVSPATGQQVQPITEVISSSGSSGSVPGADEDVIYNNTGAFAADSNLTWDYTNHILTVTNGFYAINNTSLVIIDSTTGTPNGALAANPGSIDMDQTGKLWLKTSGAGNTGWTQLATGGTSVPGLDTEVIYNKLGAFYADTNFTWSYSGEILTIGALPDATLITPDTITSNAASGFWVQLTAFTLSLRAKVSSGGNTVWSLSADGNNSGIFQLCDGSGTGGVNGIGDQLYISYVSTHAISIQMKSSLLGYCYFDPREFLMQFHAFTGTQISMYAIGTLNTGGGEILVADSAGTDRCIINYPGFQAVNGAYYSLGVGSTNVTITGTAGSPNSVVSANPGSLDLDQTGNLWVKASGTGNIGWVNAAGSVTVPGVDQEVIYNKVGSLWADANLKWDYADQILRVIGSNSGTGPVTVNIGSTLVHVGWTVSEPGQPIVTCGSGYINSGTTFSTNPAWQIDTNGTFGEVWVYNGTGTGGITNGATISLIGGNFVTGGGTITVFNGIYTTYIGNPNSAAIDITDRTLFANMYVTSSVVYGQNSGGHYIFDIGNIGGSSVTSAMQLCDGSGAGGLGGGVYVQAIGSSAGVGGGIIETLNGTISINIGQPVSSVGITITNTSTNNFSAFGPQVAYSNLSGGQNVWALAADGSNEGILRISSGTGSGGVSGLGDQFLVNYISGSVYMQMLSPSGDYSYHNASELILRQGGSSNPQVSLLSHGAIAGAGQILLSNTSGNPVVNMTELGLTVSNSSGTATCQLQANGVDALYTTGSTGVSIVISNFGNVSATNSGGSVTYFNLSGIGNYGSLQLTNGSGTGGLDGSGTVVRANISSGYVDVTSGYQVNNTQVVTSQQPGPGNPNFPDLFTAQLWAQLLLNALRAHGLVT